MIIKFLQFLKGNAIITFLLIALSGYSLFSFKYIGVLNNVIHEQQDEIGKTKDALQTERRLRRIDGETYKKLQEEAERLTRERRKANAIIDGLNSYDKNIINQPIPDSIKRVFH